MKSHITLHVQSGELWRSHNGGQLHNNTFILSYNHHHRQIYVFYAAHFLNTRISVNRVLFTNKHKIISGIDILVSRRHDKRPVSDHLHTSENHVVRHVIYVRRRLWRRTVCEVAIIWRRPVVFSRPCHVVSVQKPRHQTIWVSLGIVIGSCPDTVDVKDAVDDNNNGGDG